MPMSNTDNILRMLASMRDNLAAGPTSRVPLDNGFDFGNQFVESVADLLGGPNENIISTYILLYIHIIVLRSGPPPNRYHLK
jgi:hypothetical protein